MKPDDPNRHGLWVVGVTTDHPEPRELYIGTSQDATKYCAEHDDPLWVQAEIDEVIVDG